MNISEYLDYTVLEWENFSITLATLIGLVLIFVITKIALYVIRKILTRVFKQREVDAGQQYAFLQLIRYLVWVIAIIFMLEALSIKVTLLLAGSAALLVGLGLGLQQIFQDLVSGVFLLMEGTIKVGDIIELNGPVGKILSINLRTSQVLTRDGIVIIVPNHKFVVDNIINWSHSARLTRFKVTVGVAYGSDVELVRKLLLECANEHPNVEISRGNEGYDPFVRFLDFGDSALIFELYFWSSETFYIETTKSDLRFMIDKKFRESGVTIPFPQRDLHIKSGLPKGLTNETS